MADNPGAFLNRLSSAERKEIAVARGLFAYFPDALALVARHSVRSNEKHNPGQPVHWSREKSTDHEDCIGRHSLNIAIDPNSLDDGQPHVVCRAWRALAALQLWAEGQSGTHDITKKAICGPVGVVFDDRRKGSANRRLVPNVVARWDHLPARRRSQGAGRRSTDPTR